MKLSLSFKGAALSTKKLTSTGPQQLKTVPTLHITQYYDRLSCENSKGDLIEDMFHKEYLYFKFHETFRHVPKAEENVGLRFDPRDGNLLHRQVMSIELSGPDGSKVQFVKSPESSAEYTERLEEPLVNNCSLTKITFNNDLNMIPPSEKLLELGNKAILIWDIDRFFKALNASIESMGFEYSRGTVIYYDHKAYNGELSYLHKDMEYQFQNEYRILIGPNQNKGDLKVQIPNLKDMSALVPITDLFQYSTYSNYFFLQNINNDGKLQKKT